jgi:hypothetical protein
MRQHRLDGVTTTVGVEEIVVVRSIRREQVGHRLAVAGCRSGGEAVHDSGEVH